MALDPVKLDDLTWKGINQAIRGRIASASAGLWTLHAPVDPGVTLLELYAWLLEQRVFWMDQTPDSLVLAALRLLGAEMPKPAQTAATVIELLYQSNPPQDFLLIPSATELKPPLISPPLIFSLSSGLTLIPIRGMQLRIAGQDRSVEFNNGRTLRLFPSDGSPAEVTIILRLRKSLPTPVPNQPFTLFFDLLTPAGIPPQWSNDAVDLSTSPPAKITWRYRRPDGSLAPFNFIDDGTGGLRRTGLVQLAFPADWTEETSDGIDPDPAYAIFLNVDKSSFSFPPRLRRLVPNAAIAHNIRLTDEHNKKLEWLPLPGNVLDLTKFSTNGISDIPPLQEDFSLSLMERDGKAYNWTLTDDFSFHGPADRVFLIEREAGRLRFGDGLNGRVPALDAKKDNLTLRYRVGGGEAGNLGTVPVWESGSDPNLNANTLVPAQGGSEAETIESVAERAAALIRKPERGVTREDWEKIVETTPGVAIARSHVAIGFHPDFPCSPILGAVTVFIVPDAPRDRLDTERIESAYVAAPAPDPGALAVVRARLDHARLAGTEVFVAAARYRPVKLTVIAETATPAPNNLRKVIEEQLRKFLDPLIGGDDGQGWPFGELLRPSALLREVQHAMGEEGASISVSIQLLDRNNGEESCEDVVIGPHDLVELKDLYIHFNHAVAAKRGLR